MQGKEVKLDAKKPKRKAKKWEKHKIKIMIEWKRNKKLCKIQEKTEPKKNCIAHTKI